MLDNLHFILLGLCVLFLLIIILMIKFRSFKRLIEKLVVKAEKELKGEKGKVKLNYVLALLKKSSLLAKLLSNSRLIGIVNKMVEEFNKFNK